MVTSDGGGYATYRYGRWNDLQTTSKKHIKDVACSYGEPTWPKKTNHNGHHHKVWLKNK